VTEEDRERDYIESWELSDADRAPTNWSPEPPPDPADYCPECGKPLARCRAWNEGDHSEADLL